ncbi:MAG: hypothetical protein ACI857_003179 [Arenicella sp.]|jgi:hypothetical protein
MTKQIFALILFASIAFSCGSKKWGTPTGIEMRHAENAEINYGKKFRVQTFLKYDSGKEKDVTDKTELKLRSKGAELSGSFISISSYPTSFQNDTIVVTASYVKKDLNFSIGKKIPFNYKGELMLQFSGEEGLAGTIGSDGSTPLLFRSGKPGDAGGLGGNGGTGHDVSVHIYKSEKDSLYYIKVTDLNASQIFFFKNKDVGFPITIHSTGGRGGQGGLGGDGGDGKDGKKTEKKVKSPGSGGSAGDGGIGGIGGNGGTVFVIIHPSAKEIQSRITAYVLGGPGGEGGPGGAGGKGGGPLEGQEKGSDGLSGDMGAQGAQGIVGMPIQMIVEDFDIDY